MGCHRPTPGAPRSVNRSASVARRRLPRIRACRCSRAPCRRGPRRPTSRCRRQRCRHRCSRRCRRTRRRRAERRRHRRRRRRRRKCSGNRCCNRHRADRCTCLAVRTRIHPGIHRRPRMDRPAAGRSSCRPHRSCRTRPCPTRLRPSSHRVDRRRQGLRPSSRRHPLPCLTRACRIPVCPLRRCRRRPRDSTHRRTCSHRGQRPRQTDKLDRGNEACATPNAAVRGVLMAATSHPRYGPNRDNSRRRWARTG